MNGFVLRGKSKEVFALLRLMAFIELLNTTIPHSLKEECLNCGFQCQKN